MKRELNALIEIVNKERKVELGINLNCDGCENEEFEVTDIYDANKSGLSEDFYVVYHGNNKIEAMAAIMRYVRAAEYRRK